MHPHLNNLDNLTDMQLEDKIIDLQRKFFQTPNPDLQNQIVLLLDDYKIELEARRAKQKLKIQEQNGENGLDSLINIS